MMTTAVKAFPNGLTASWLRLILNFLVLPVMAILLIHDRQLTRIEASRFTAVDGQEVYKQMANMRESIALLPPDSFELKVEGLVETMTDLRIEVANITSRLDTLIADRERE